MTRQEMSEIVEKNRRSQNWPGDRLILHSLCFYIQL